MNKEMNYVLVVTALRTSSRCPSAPPRIAMHTLVFTFQRRRLLSLLDERSTCFKIG
jgi:hypothetical protein